MTFGFLGGEVSIDCSVEWSKGIGGQLRAVDVFFNDEKSEISLRSGLPIGLAVGWKLPAATRRFIRPEVLSVLGIHRASGPVA